MIPKYTTRGHMCMHSTPPQHGSQCATNTYRADVPDVGVPNKKASDNCYQFTTPTLLMYSRGGIPQDSPLNHMRSPRPHGFVYIASFWLANQSSVSNQHSESD